MSKEEILQFIAECKKDINKASKNLQYISFKKMQKALEIIEELLESDSNE